MGRHRLARRLSAVLVIVASAALVFTGTSAAQPASAPDIDWHDAAAKLRAVAQGNPAAEAAMDRLQVSPMRPLEQKSALPAQVFQVPAFSNIGRMDPASGQLYGSGIALGTDGFRFGFFGGPGTISPNQTGAGLFVVWLNLSNGLSGTNQLVEHQDVLVDTSIRTAPLNTGPGTVVAAVYGSLWHRWPVAVDEQHKDGFAYAKGEIFWPSLGAVLT